MIPSNEQIQEWSRQQAEIDKQIPAKVAALKKAFEELQEILGNHEDFTLKMTMGKSSNDIYCLISDLQNAENVAFSALNHANRTQGWF